jgi:predicted aspartyl protease
MRVSAKMGSYEVMVLIDSGSTHNFISNHLARMLRLPVIPTESFHVRVANGEGLTCKGRYDKVRVELQGTTFYLTFFSLRLTGLELLLGVQWLEMLGYVVCNWKQLTMDFVWENQDCRLQGVDVQTIQTASPTKMAKEFRRGHALFAVCFQLTEETALTAISMNDDNQSMHCLLQEYADVFQQPSRLPPAREVDHCIMLKEGTEPINVRPYRYAHFQKTEIEKQVQEMLDSRLIRPSTSPFSSPVLLVKKKDGSWRFCTDYRSLNVATVKDRFPIPTVDDMLEELYGATYFTKLELRVGYHQVRVNPSDVNKTAFRTHNGHYEYLVMPFGLSNAPSTFQAIINSIFRPYLRKFILVFFYDILVYSPTWNEHLLHVKQTLDTLRQHQFFAKDNKCVFGQQELEYLGHIVTHRGVKVDNSKIAAMVAWPPPTTISELRGFLGLTGYYRKFIQNYGIIARPLTNLLKKGKFGWNEDADTAFLALKQAMTTTPILAMPNFDDSFTIETDASGDGIGAILSQQGRPIAFMSRGLGVTKQSWSTYAKEMLAIFLVTKQYWSYVFGALISWERNSSFSLTTAV